MTASKKLIQAAAGSGGAGFYPYTVDNSARFNDNDSPKLLRTQTAGNRKIATFSFWVKRSTLGSYQHIITGGYDDGTAVSDSAPIRLRSDDKIEFLEYINGYAFHVISNAVFRDTSAWYHFVWVMDTTQATSSNRIKLYVNGVQQSFGSTSYPSQNYDTNYNASGEQTQIGYQGQTPSSGDRSYFDGYMAEFHYIDGTAYDASAFGEFKNGVWVPKSPSVTYGTNGFYLDFGNSGALGTDSSGNGNNFTVSGLTSSDQMIDTPTNNFPTYNPIDSYSSGLSEGNLKFANGTGVGYKGISTFAIPDISDTQKYYVEYVADSGYLTGIVTLQNNGSNSNVSYSDIRGYYTNGYKYQGTTSSPYGASHTASNVMALLVGNGSIEFFKDGVSQGVAFSGLTGSWKIATVAFGSAGAGVVYNYGQNGTFNGTKTAGGNTDANGIGDFKYTVPTGALALCTANLPEPSIGPNSTTTSGENFNTVLYTGTGAAQSITGLGFQPDFLWFKSRSGAYNNIICDAIRGPTKQIIPNNTSAEQTAATGYDLVSFDSDGFSVGPVNLSSSINDSGNIVSWAWKGNGSGVSNTDGSITSTVSANTDAGISIVTYTGTGSAGTIGHGLGAVPKLIIIKNRVSTVGGTNWQVYHASLGNGKRLFLNLTNAENTSSIWNNTTPTSSVFSLSAGSEWNQSSSDTYVAYCFAEVEGFSKFGSWTGQSGSEFIYTGFRPAFVMVKRTNTSGWYIFDNKRGYNGGINSLQPNTNGTEAGPWATQFNLYSNGFEDGNFVGDAGTTIIYAAFAETPFKYSNAR